MIKTGKKLTLEEVKGHHITELAEAAHCSNEYVRKIVLGDREAHSIKARAILRAAISLNNFIKKGKAAADQELQIISEGAES